jgi:putative acetyltransferase
VAIEIRPESPLQDDVRALIAELNAALLALTPPEFCYHMTVEQMADAATTVWIARRDGEALGCGALRRIGGGAGEVKRMFVRPDLQGQGIAGRIVGEIEATARAEGLDRLLLETGDRHPAAWRVYERAGFTRCGAFGEYPDSGYSVFYQKLLGVAADA